MQTVFPIIFTDLDGTLLDHYSYSFEPARPAIECLRRHHIPLVFNTSKTFAELKVLAAQMDNRQPMIVENGGGVVVPAGHPLARSLGEGEGSYRRMTLGADRNKILAALEPLRARYHFRGFNQMEVAELIEQTGLSKPAAQMAMEREFSEPLVWLDDHQRLADFAEELARHSLYLLRGGRFVHVVGGSDKGKAMNQLADRWRALTQGQNNPSKDQSKIVTIALGDGENDLAMLESADYPIVIRSPVHEPLTVKNSAVRVSGQYGPSGWAEMLLSLLPELGYSTEKQREIR